MFGKVNKEKIEQQNQSLEQEMHNTKPEATNKGASNAVGNVMGISGSAALIIAGVGAAFVALNAIMAYFGLSAIVTVLILMAVGLIFQFFASKLITDPWIQPA